MRRTSLGKAMFPYVDIYIRNINANDVAYNATSNTVSWSYRFQGIAHNGLPLNSYGFTSTTVTFEENESPYDKPIMGYIVWNGENIQYNFTQQGRDYYQEYLTFYTLEDSSFSFNGYELSYSLDSGETWVELPANTSTPTFPSGSTIMWKGYLEEAPTHGLGTFSASGEFKAYGNLLTLAVAEEALGELFDYIPNELFRGLFKNCNTLVIASGLAFPSITSEGMCKEMFYGCSSLVTPPILPFHEVDVETCEAMFQGCTSLEDASSILNVELTLAPYCFKNMFSDCTSLVYMPSLFTTVVEEGSCQGMFSGCTSIGTTPLIGANVIADYGCESMFKGCTSLFESGLLQASNLGEYCYANMFQGCTSLEVAPELNASTLVNGCYNGMFSGCTSLNSITCMASSASTDITSCTTNWVSNVAPSGVFTKLEMFDLPLNSVHGVPNGWSVNNINYTKQYFTLVPTAQETSFLFSSNGYTSMEYSLDSGQTWSVLHTNGGVDVPYGQKLMLRGTITSTTYYTTSIGQFRYIYNAFKVEGNIMSLLYGDNFSGITSFDSDTNLTFRSLFSGCSMLVDARNLVLPATTLASDCYLGMFANCDSLTEAPQLPATTVAYRCYHGMFSGCTSLTVAPQLPATTLENGCYSGMFSGCTSLTKAPELPATTLAQACYNGMFQGCTSLTVAPQLSATTLAYDCYYNMFQGCTSLTVAPQLPATTLASECYLGMFANCTSLTVAPQLPATTLAYSCYRSMFLGCTSLTVAPQLPATTLTSNCYSYMFSNCTSLTTAPQLLATTLDSYCYYNMFDGCTSLTVAPQLPATTLAYQCYYSMFSNCTSLTTAPQLPATELAQYCYYNMFQSCTSLTTVPSDMLPATTLANYCYSYMFQGCTNLTTAPILPATTLVTNCYIYMFYNCSRLNYINARFTTTPSTTYTSNWVYGVASSGTFVKGSGATWTNTGIHAVPTTWVIVNEQNRYADVDPSVTYYCYKGDKYSEKQKQVSIDGGVTWTNSIPSEYTINQKYESGSADCPIDTPNERYLTFTALGDGTFKFSGNTISYSTDFGLNWKNITSNSPITVTSGQVVMWKGSLIPSLNYGIGVFISSTNFNVDGNVMSLLYNDDFSGQTSLSGKSDAFRGLFSGSSVVDASALILPATTLAQGCYQSMFYGCTSLTVAPQLLATTLADWCYSYMFQGCTSLTEAPQLPATTLANYCYSYMFQGCTSLTVAPQLSATTLAGQCYSNMFQGCSSLTVAPQLPATTLTSQCYRYMFQGCTSLTVAPILSAMTLANNCYDAMFLGCSSLTVAPQLPATTLASGCYNGMFQGCTSLTEAPQLQATTLASTCYYSMFRNCTSLTEAPELPATTLASACYYTMFSGCTSLTVAPQLPATTLAINCYNGMFQGCTSLTEAPQLLATTLESNCYASMFQGCTSLNKIDAQFLTTPSTAYTQNWVDNVANSGTFIKNPLATWNTETNRGVNGVPTNWVVKKTDSDTCTSSTENYISDISYRDTVNCITSQIQISFAYCTDTIGSDCTISTESINDYVTVEIGTNSSLEPRTVSGTVTYSGASFDYFVTQSGYVDYSKEYFTLIPRTSSMSFKHSNVGSVSYSIYNGTNWGSWYTLSTSSTVYVSSGQKIRFKSTLTPNSSNGIGSFSGSSQFDVEGNVMSLLYGDNFSGQTSLSGKDYAFYRLFSGNGVVDASALILPATTLVQYCYYYMFYNCYSLTTAPQLPATTLAQYCYYCMFYNCTSLTIAPQLPATTLAIYCYYDMFYNCTSLTIAPQLPATTLSQSCYQYMFYNCTSLTEAPQLPATTLAIDCYNGMFHNCYSLTTAPQLPATTLAAYCYDSMFRSCSGLTEAPQLPATTLKSGCYQEMFYACTSLEVAPQLPATTLVTNCYSNMFNSCTSLNKIDAQFLTTPITAYTYNWVANVANSGTFIKNVEATWDVVGVNGVPTNWVVKASDSDTCTESIGYITLSNISYPSDVRYNVSSIAINFSYSANVINNDCILTKEVGTDSVVVNIGTNSSVEPRTVSGTVTYSGATIEYSVNQRGYVDYSKQYFTLEPRSAATTFRFSTNSISYSLDSGSTWTSLASNTNTPSVGIGNKIMFKASGLTPSSSYGIGTFSGSSKFDVEGNAMSLMYGDDFSGQTSLSGKSYAFRGLFSGSSVVDASALILPAMTLAQGCYQSMFNGCSGLTDAPQLPATTLAEGCYNAMFARCSGLTVAPQLQATTLARDCYNYMFASCTSLTVVPQLPATTLERECYYQMFSGCTSLTIAPSVLPATTLAYQCYLGMFANCTSLTTPPSSIGDSSTRMALNACTQMFSGCTSLTEAPQLPATTLANNCYSSMFYGCTRLTEAPQLSATTLADGCYNGMFASCTSLTVTPQLPATTLAYQCYLGMFANCTSLTIAPQLPATTLAQGCYNSMFYGCTSLTTPPSSIGDSSTVMQVSACTQMFSGCSGLTTTPQLQATTSANYCYSGMFNGCTSLTVAPQLLATTLASNCYNAMFQGCSSLTVAPQLPATTLADSCYRYMFNGCSSLTVAPQLPATRLASNCYERMFQSCDLIVAPQLLATTLADSCYANMFQNCTSLTEAPQLPATTLVSSCYYAMFQNCSSLTVAPQLPATTLESQCYLYMFQYCTSLNKIDAKFTTTPSTSYTYNWVNGVASSGTFIRNIAASWDIESNRGVNGVPTNWNVKVVDADQCTEESMYVVYNTSYPNDVRYYVSSITISFDYALVTIYDDCSGSASTSSADSITVNIGTNSSVEPRTVSGTVTYSGVTIEYSVNQRGYVDYSQQYLTLEPCSAATTFTFRNSNNSISYSLDSGSTWTSLAINTSTPSVSVGNKIMFKASSLTPSSSYGIGRFSGSSQFDVEGNVMSLLYGDNFSGQTSLSGKDYAFKHLFSGSSVVDASALILPATTLANECYSYMFNGCSGLTVAPQLPATTLESYCYNAMFSACTSLTEAPILPATTLANYCYQYMFNGCSSLTVAPQLSATTLADYCYRNMFQGCTSLTVAPQLSATTLAQYCYSNMFQGCTSLTVAPQLPATTLAECCYQYMFYNCTSLTTAPQLLATTLANSCYYGMFNRCTSLTVAPQLPATTLVNQCYGYMFSGCTSLNKIDAQFLTTPSTLYTYNWVSGVASSGTFIRSKFATWNPINYVGVNGIPNGWLNKIVDSDQCTDTTYLDIYNISYPTDVRCSTSYLNINFNYSMITVFTNCDGSATTSSADSITVNIGTNSSVEPRIVSGTVTYSGVTIEYSVNQRGYVDYSQQYLTFEPRSAATTFKFSGNSISYSLDSGSNWTSLASNTASPSVGVGEKIMFKGNLTPTSSGIGRFSGSSTFDAEGNVMSLMYGDSFASQTSLSGKNNAFQYLFSGSSVVDASALSLPATTLTSNCYYAMFNYCTSLTVAPSALPATKTSHQCYCYMFNNCPNLVIAPLSIGDSSTTMMSYACYYMFSSCSKLRIAPELPAMNVGASAYTHMFDYCTSLTTTPSVLPATILGQQCYYGMFNGCTSLTTPPSSIGNSSTTMAESACTYMFSGCTALETAPELPATTLANNCYANMFYLCSGLTTAPSVLPSTIMSYQCYYQMFEGCRSLTKAPILPAMTLDGNNNRCYRYMFRGCTSLNYINAQFLRPPHVDYTEDWVSNVASSGTFIKNPLATWDAEDYIGTDGIPNGWTVKMVDSDTCTAETYCYVYDILYVNKIKSNVSSIAINFKYALVTTKDDCTASATTSSADSITVNIGTNSSVNPRTVTGSVTYSGATIEYSVEQDGYVDYANEYLTLIPRSAATTFKFSGNSINYSLDNGSTWTSLTSSTETPSVGVGSKIMFKGNLTPTSSGIGRFSGSSTFDAEGNVMSLLYGDSFANQTDLSEKSYAFYRLFSERSVVDASALILPATTLADSCYREMFYNCTSLTEAPSVLPATILAQYCYYRMFMYCYKLTTPPQLLATTLADYCYQYMFYGCSDLIIAPQLPATTLARGCYNCMFTNCSKLSTVPSSIGTSSTTMATSACSYMFSGCISLTVAPQLPATTLANTCYYSMFNGCYKLTTPPSSIGNSSTTMAESACTNMFSGCTSLVTVPSDMLPATTLASSCYSSMFYSCSGLTVAPELPATTLANNCYDNMFSYCRNLTTAPILSATTLAVGCYRYMFNNCTRLNYIDAKFTTTPILLYTYNWVQSVADSGTFIKNSSATWDVRGVHGIPTNWTVKVSDSDSCVTSTDFVTSNVSYINNVKCFVSSVTIDFDCGLRTINNDCTVTYSSVEHKSIVVNIGTNSSTSPRTVSGTVTYSGATIEYSVEQDGYVDYANEYLTLVPRSAATTFKFSGNSINYSLDNGSTWTSLASDTASPSVGVGEKIMFKASGLTVNANYGIGTFSGSSYFDVEGNVMSLRYGDDFSGKTSLVNNAFRWLFSSSKVVDASGLVLPATTLGTGCYSNMFNGCSGLTTPPSSIGDSSTMMAASACTYMFSNCTSLTVAPLLPATTLADSCYRSMFNGCSGLTVAPSSIGDSSTTMGVSACTYMFSGCTSLTVAPQLPATTLASDCYSNMFNGCSGLTVSPSLLATTLASNCYQSMFANCTSLTVASELPATTLAEGCYQYMFHGCPSLTTAPSVLPATTLVRYCYADMFYNCSSLTTAPVLSATTLATQCCDSMFRGCTSLTTAPKLLATTLASACYNYMFYGCTSLNKIDAQFLTEPTSSYTNSWVYNVAKSGTFIKNSSATWDVRGYHGIPTDWVTKIGDGGCTASTSCVVSDVSYPSNVKCIVSSIAIKFSYSANIITNDCTVENRSGNDSIIVNIGTNSSSSPRTVSGTVTYSGATIEYSIEQDGFVDYSQQYFTLEPRSAATTFKFSGNSISYSLDSGTTWTSLASNTDTPSVVVGNKIMFKATGLTPSSSYGIGKFSGSSAFDAEGNVMSLLYGDSFASQTDLTGKNYAFYNLFNNSSIVDASALILPATTLASYCYQSMFTKCSNLIIAPQLPATTLANSCYGNMFDGCSGLTVAPELPATTLAQACYYTMFGGCIGLKVAPVLSATTLATSCYNTMFYSCSGLTVAPELPATTLANYCYNGMFSGCTSLTTPPSSIGDSSTTMTTSACTNMFRSCTSLTVAPELPARTLASCCYRGMFNGCTRLTVAPELPATTLASSGYSEMFRSCYRLTVAPQLPATTLANSCYSEMFTFCSGLTVAPSSIGDSSTTMGVSACTYMFSGCTNLSTAPELPARTLAGSCYNQMFYNCTNLSTAPELPATTLASRCYYQMFYNCRKIDYIKALFTTKPNDYNSDSTYYWLYNTKMNGTFVKNSNATWNTEANRGPNGVPDAWTVETITP